MRYIILLPVVLTLAACGEQHKANAVFVETVKEVFNGDCSRIALPDFMGCRPHLAAGQYVKADGSIGGQPSGPRF